MPDYKLQFIIDAENRAKAAIDQVKGQMDSVQGKLKDMEPAFKKMALVGTAGFAAVTAAVYKSVQAYQEEERANQRLAHLLKQTSNATDEQVAALMRQSAALQKVGVVGDETVKFGQSQLATFALQAETIGVLAPSLMDLAVAVKGVNVEQEDMINLGNLVGKVMTGQTSALSRYGVILNDTQREQLEQGNEMERAIVLSEILQQNFGGLNEAMRNTSEGGMKALKNSFGDMQEMIGAQFIPILESLVEKITPVLEKVMDWIEKNPELTRNIIIATAALFGLVAILGTLGLILPGIIGLFSATTLAALPIIGVMLGIMAVVGLLIAIGWNLYKDWDLIMEGLGLYWQDFYGKVKDIWQELVIDFKTGVNFLIGLAEGFANAWVKAINAVIGALNKIHISVPDWVPGIGGKSWGINISKVGEITLPRLAEGGLITKPTSVLAGEAGPEAIVPLNKMALAGGRTVNVYIQGGYFLSETVAEELGDFIISKLKRTMKI